MRIAKIRKEDIANGPGIRVSVYVQGCGHHCKGCFNPETWDFEGGHLLNRRLMVQIAELGKDRHIAGFSILGGEPMHQDTGLVKLLDYLKKETGKPIWMWSGCTWEEIQQDEYKKTILRYVDTLVDGRFDENQKAVNKRFRGSLNQRIIDVQESLKQEEIIFSEFN